MVTIAVDELWSASSREVVKVELIVVETRWVARGEAMRREESFVDVDGGIAACGANESVENLRGKGGLRGCEWIVFRGGTDDVRGCACRW